MKSSQIKVWKISIQVLQPVACFAFWYVSTDIVNKAQFADITLVPLDVQNPVELS
jgi:hypothetical protein